MTQLTSPSLHASDLWANRTVGVLGGSFNPAHEGHRHASLEALKHLNLDAVWWLVSPQNPLKPVKGMATLEKRLAAARATARHPGIFVTAIERDLKTRYTADTLAKLLAHFPRTRFVWLMGTDNLHQIHLWKRWQDIFATVPVCVIDREVAGGRLRSCPALERYRPSLLEQSKAKTLAKRPLPAWTILHAPLNGESATRLRRKARKL
jgi:nicotinate-nucleotide adenylyltransferase